MKKILILILLITIFIYPVIGINQAYVGNMTIGGNHAIDYQILDNHSTYTTFVDHIQGFYRVYKNENNFDELVDYHNKTLYINKEDIVFWSNEAVPDTRLTILSKQNLWQNIRCGAYLCSDLRWNYKKFGYIFNKSGIYNIYIQQFPRFNQTIIVGPLSELTLNNIKRVNNTINETHDNNLNRQPNMQPTSTVTPRKNLTSSITDSNSNLNSYNLSISNIKIQLTSRFDTIILVIVLLSIVVLSGRIKDENIEEIENN